MSEKLTDNHSQTTFVTHRGYKRIIKKNNDGHFSRGRKKNKTYKNCVIIAKKKKKKSTYPRNRYSNTRCRTSLGNNCHARETVRVVRTEPERTRVTFNQIRIHTDSFPNDSYTNKIIILSRRRDLRNDLLYES